MYTDGLQSSGAQCCQGRRRRRCRRRTLPWSGVRPLRRLPSSVKQLLANPFSNTTAAAAAAAQRYYCYCRVQDCPPAALGLTNTLL